jgi:hypothetical protein
MAFDIETENQRHLDGWQGFCKYSSYAIIAAIVTMILMAVFVV